jgi:steroid delta-isomerase-like uncharacterized protein
MIEPYLAAWAARDVDAIMQFHTEDTVFQMHTTGEEAHGKDAVRAAFVASLEQMPDLEFDSLRLRVGDGFFAHEMVWRGTLSQPAEIGGEVIGTEPMKVEFDAVDVIEIREGLVARKDSYVDSVAVQNQLAAAQVAA